MKNKRLLIGTLFLLSITIAHSQKKQPDFEHVEPSFWWVGMKNPTVQLLFHNSRINISAYKPEIQYPGVTLKEIKTVANPHYLFLTLEIASMAKAGKIPVTFTA